MSSEVAPVSTPETLDPPAHPDRPRARPVEAGERVASVDVLRGVALLGILAMNIAGFAWPWVVYEVPVLATGAGPGDTALWAFNHVVFDTKMMTIFSMLFGAGLVLMADRAEGRGARFRGVYFRRVAWLLVIGLVHAYLIWDGDILVLYACCGFLLYPFRNLRPRTLILTGVAMNLLLVPIFLGFRFGGVPYMRATAARVEADKKAGRPVGAWDQIVHDGWDEMQKGDRPKPQEFLEEVEAYRDNYWGIVRHRAKDLVWEHTLGFVLGGWWMAGGRMLVGMGLMKLGVFAAALSRRAYLWMLAVGYGVGLPLMIFDAYHQASHGFFLDGRMAYTLDGWPLLTLYGSVPVVFGHVGAVMLVCQSGAWTWLTRRLAAVGRMALSNYLFDSLLCTTLFYGYGLDLFATLHRPLLYLIVLTVWLGHLLVCPLWLEAFRFGPAEWVWRSLTYWKLQPWRVRRDEVAAAGAS